MYRSYTPAGLFLVFSLLAKFKGKMHLKYLSLHFSWHYWLAWVVHNCQIKYNKNSFTVIRICSFWMQPFLSSHNSFSSTAAIVVLYLPYTLLFFFATLFLIKARCLFIYLLFHWSIRFFKKIKLFQEVFKNMKCCTILWWVRYASYLRFILHKRVKRFVIKYKWLQMVWINSVRGTTLDWRYYKSSSSQKESFSFPHSHKNGLQENPSYSDHRLVGIRNYMF